MEFNNLLEVINDETLKQMADNILNKYHYGEMFIEFALNQQNNVELIVKFSPEINWLLNKNGKANKPIYFSSIQTLRKHIIQSITSRFDSDLKKVDKYLINIKELDNVFNEIIKFAHEFKNKAQSLSFDNNHAQKNEKNTGWDMKIIFRKSSHEFIKNNIARITPSISGKRKYGVIIDPEEIEKPRKPKIKNKFIQQLNTLQ